MTTPSPEILIPGATPLAQLRRILRTGAPARLPDSARPGVAAAAAHIAAAPRAAPRSTA